MRFRSVKFISTVVRLMFTSTFALAVPLRPTATRALFRSVPLAPATQVRCERADDLKCHGKSNEDCPGSINSAHPFNIFPQLSESGELAKLITQVEQFAQASPLRQVSAPYFIGCVGVEWIPQRQELFRSAYLRYGRLFLAERWPDRYTFDVSAPLKTCDRQRIVCANTWRQAHGLDALPMPTNNEVRVLRNEATKVMLIEWGTGSV